MSQLRIAYRYAKSILELAAEQNDLSRVSEDFDYLREAFKGRELHNLVKSPIINKAKKLDIFNKLFTGKLSDLTVVFLNRVITKGRESLIPEILTSFVDQYNEKKGIVAATLITTSDISNSAMENLKRKINAFVGADKQITLEVKKDDSLIGGYVLEYEDKRYDASVKYKLENIQKSFSA
jgi:F-type H+-transporting ATPase subunit delta